MNLDRAASFWKMVDKRGPDECWPWKGHIGQLDGYGRATYRGRYQTVGRIVLAIMRRKPVGPSKIVKVRCLNRACCNPAHLECIPKINYLNGISKKERNDIVSNGKQEILDEGLETHWMQEDSEGPRHDPVYDLLMAWGMLDAEEKKRFLDQTASAKYEFKSLIDKLLLDYTDPRVRKLAFLFERMIKEEGIEMIPTGVRVKETNEIDDHSKQGLRKDDILHRKDEDISQENSKEYDGNGPLKRCGPLNIGYDHSSVENRFGYEA